MADLCFGGCGLLVGNEPDIHVDLIKLACLVFTNV
jgi:hypothetical protein